MYVNLQLIIACWNPIAYRELECGIQDIWDLKIFSKTLLIAVNIGL